MPDKDEFKDDMVAQRLRENLDAVEAEVVPARLRSLAERLSETLKARKRG